MTTKAARKRARNAEAAPAPPDTLIDRIARCIAPLAAAVLFVTAWIDPARLSRETIHSLRATMVVEFLAIHSGAFLCFLLIRASKDSRKMVSSLLLMVPLFLIYVGAAWNIQKQVHAWWPLLAAAWLLGGRVAPLFIGDAERQRAAITRVVAEWACALAVFIASSAIVQNAGLPLGALATLDPASFPIAGWKSSLSVPQEIQWGALHFAALTVLAWLVPFERVGMAVKRAFENAPPGD